MKNVELTSVDEWLVHDVIDTFEDFLDEHNIQIENPEKQQAIDDGEDPHTIAIIFGSDYDKLLWELWHTMETYKQKLSATDHRVKRKASTSN